MSAYSSAATKRKTWCLLFPARLTIANVTDWTVRRAK